MARLKPIREWRWEGTIQPRSLGAHRIAWETFKYYAKHYGRYFNHPGTHPREMILKPIADYFPQIRAARICYEDRASVYGSMLHNLEIYNRLDGLLTLFGLTSASPTGIVNRGFPTRIDRESAQLLMGADELSWFVSNNILRPTEADAYGLVDEFLRVRVLLDQAESEHERELLEQRLINGRVRIDY